MLVKAVRIRFELGGSESESKGVLSNDLPGLDGEELIVELGEFSLGDSVRAGK